MENIKVKEAKENACMSGKYLDPKADLTFKLVFGEHPDLVMSLLNALLPLADDGQFCLSLHQNNRNLKQEEDEKTIIAIYSKHPAIGSMCRECHN